MARPGRPERNRAARSFRQLMRFDHVINSDKVFGTHRYLLADRTCKLSPDGWGRRAVDAYREFKADRIIAERNFGGAMVEHVIRSIDPNVPYREVTASRGKVARLSPRQPCTSREK